MNHWDEILEQELREQLRDLGYDETTIDILVEEAREGNSIEALGIGAIWDEYL